MFEKEAEEYVKQNYCEMCVMADVRKLGAGSVKNLAKKRMTQEERLMCKETYRKINAYRQRKSDYAEECVRYEK